METETLATKLEFFKFISESIMNFDKDQGNPIEIEKITELFEPFIEQMSK